MQISLEDAIANLAAKGEALADALNLESQLEDDRALVKPEAIKRIMARDGIAATPASMVSHFAKSASSISEIAE